MTVSDILEFLKQVQHPAKGDRSISDLGMLEDIVISDSKISVTIVFPKHRDPLAEYLIGTTRAVLIRYAPEYEIEVKTKVKEDVKKSANKASLELGFEELDSVKNIIGVASGKGGVGKSTVAVNLAIALSRLGYKVGLADADVYGPSVPKMTGTEDELPEAFNEGDKEIILPIEKYGVKWMSIGYFAKPEQALIWRGPMACNALKQMILQVRWGELDFLLIDMPPGTGDIHISLVHDLPMGGAVLVSTPGDVALADVEKSINMFRNEEVNKKIYGFIENMSWFTPEELPDNKYYIFGKGGALKMAKKYNIPSLGQIPVVQNIREGGDNGEPVALNTRADGLAFITIAKEIVNLAAH